MDNIRFISTGNADEFVVRAPRATDAIGNALRGAFHCRVDLPADMRTALERLQRR